MAEPARAPVASSLPPAVVRDPQVIRFDMLEASGNIDLLTFDLEGDGSNRQDIIGRIKKEVTWLGELLSELEAIR